jgi:basic amino acid/polyamine antiporter, APA family
MVCPIIAGRATHPVYARAAYRRSDDTQEEGKKLKRSLGPFSLIAFGIGAVIGSGIFTVTGTAAAGQHLSYRSALNAPVLDLMLHGRASASLIGRPGAGPGIR